jgi:hypothetical protein
LLSYFCYVGMKIYLTSSSYWVWTFFLRRLVTISHWVLFLLRFLFGIRTFSNVCSCVGSFHCNGPCCCKSSHSRSSSKLKIKIEPTCSLMPAFLLGFLKLHFLKVSLQSLLLFFNHFKSSLKLR